MKVTLAEHGLTPSGLAGAVELRLGTRAAAVPPAISRTDLELSSGAMTSRLDRLEEAGLVRRLPDPDDRRGVVVELTGEGLRPLGPRSKRAGAPRGVLRAP